MSTAWALHAVRRSGTLWKTRTSQSRQLWSFLRRPTSETSEPVADTETTPNTQQASLAGNGSFRAPGVSSVPVSDHPVGNGSSFAPSESEPPRRPKPEWYREPDLSNRKERLVGSASIRFLSRGVELSDSLGTAVFDYTHLRDSCQCASCVDPSTTQRTFQTADIPQSIVPRQAIRSRNQLKLFWSNDVSGYDETHGSTYNIELLRKQSLEYAFMRKGKATLREIEVPKNRNLWDTDRLKHQTDLAHSYPEIMTNSDSLYSMLAFLQSWGIVFLRDVPESPVSVGAIADRIGGVKKTFYGDMWDVKSVPKAANVAYTSQFLGYHMDLLYMNEPPGIQLLHCLTNTCKGGESMFADAFRVASSFRKNRKRDYHLLSSFPVQFQYRNDSKAYSAIRSTFEVKGSIGDIESLRNVNWSPPFQGSLKHHGRTKLYEGLRQRDGSDHFLRGFIAASQAFSKELESDKNTFELKLEPGQCVIFLNRRIVHARRAFEEATGERWLRGAYVDIQDFQSKLSFLHRRKTGGGDNFGEGIEAASSQSSRDRKLPGELDEWTEIPLHFGHSPIPTTGTEFASTQLPGNRKQNGVMDEWAKNTRPFGRNSNSVAPSQESTYFAAWEALNRQEYSLQSPPRLQSSPTNRSHDATWEDLGLDDSAPEYVRPSHSNPIANSPERVRPRGIEWQSLSRNGKERPDSDPRTSSVSLPTLRRVWTGNIVNQLPITYYQKTVGRSRNARETKSFRPPNPVVRASTYSPPLQSPHPVSTAPPPFHASALTPPNSNPFHESSVTTTPSRGASPTIKIPPSPPTSTWSIPAFSPLQFSHGIKQDQTPPSPTSPPETDDSSTSHDSKGNSYGINGDEQAVRERHEVETFDDVGLGEFEKRLLERLRLRRPEDY